MHVSLTPKLEELVRRKVKSGYYNNASEVIREALRLMVAQDEVYERKLANLRKALEEGKRSGFADDFSFERLNAKLDAEERGDAVDSAEPRSPTPARRAKASKRHI